MIAVIDYGVGNLFSLVSSLKTVGADVKVVSDPKELAFADKIVLPGVGAFGDAALKLRESGLGDALKDEAKKGKPLLGICLGMQLLFERSYEYGTHEGLGLLKGEIIPMEGNIPSGLKIPQIGWNALHTVKNCYLDRYLSENECVYFVHSYYADGCAESLAATVEYGKEITAMVSEDNVSGCQFHPEKSGKAGLSILRAFYEGDK